MLRISLRKLRNSAHFSKKASQKFAKLRILFVKLRSFCEELRVFTVKSYNRYKKWSFCAQLRFSWHYVRKTKLLQRKSAAFVKHPSFSGINKRSFSKAKLCECANTAGFCEHQPSLKLRKSFAKAVFLRNAKLLRMCQYRRLLRSLNAAFAYVKAAFCEACSRRVNDCLLVCFS